jgi:hypothetical protein
MPDFYPTRIADLIPWHSNFNIQAIATGVARGLAAAQVTQITADSAEVSVVVNYVELVASFAQAVTAYKDVILAGSATEPMPPVPTPPAAITVPVGALPGIEARTRLFASIIRAQPTYTAQIGELYGIVVPAAASQKTPSLVAQALTVSQVRLKIAKAGFAVLAVDSRRGGGEWEPIGVSQTAVYIDARAPLTAGQPELREYRCQGLQYNARVGAMSGVVSAVTIP